MNTSRRRLLRATAVTGAVVSLGSRLPEPGVRPASAQETPAGVSVDALRIAMQTLPTQLDPQTAVAIPMVRVYCMVFDTLVQQDWSDNGNLVPGLALSWTQVDETTLDFALRQDVVWHDGTPFTAADVKFTFDRTLQGDARLYGSGLYPIQESIVLDDHTIRFTTPGPRGSFLFQFADQGAGIVPAAYFQRVGYEAFQRMPIGTGPYRVTEFVPDTHVRFEVNQHYWGGTPVARTVEVRGIPEVSTRIAALLNDEIDLAMDLPPDQLVSLDGSDDFAISDVAPLNANIFAIVGSNPPLDRKEIRQAMSLGIDRQAIVQQLLGGYGVWPTGIQSTLDPLYTERPPLPYDPDRAKELLGVAGYAGEEIRLAFDSPNYYPLEQEWCQAIVSMWGDIGLNVSMSPIEASQRATIDATSDWGLFVVSVAVIADTSLPLNYATPTSPYQKLFPAGQFEELNALVDQAQQTVDTGQRRDLTRQAVDFLEDFVMVLVIVTINRISASRGTIVFQETPRFGIELRPGRFSVTV